MQLDAVTIDEAMVRTSVSPAPLSQIKLVEMALSPELLESKRVSMLADIVDQDAFFQLMIKPGSTIRTWLYVSQPCRTLPRWTWSVSFWGNVLLNHMSLRQPGSAYRPYMAQCKAVGLNNVPIRYGHMQDV